MSAPAQDAGTAARAAVKGKAVPKTVCQIVDGKFADYRWKDGRWVYAEFPDGKGGTDWDAVSAFCRQQQQPPLQERRAEGLTAAAAERR